MSNRTYTIVLSIAVAALIAAVVASYFLHRLTLSPVAIYLLGFLILVPGAAAIRLLPSYFVVRAMSPALRERMRDRREHDPAPAYAVWTCAASFGTSFVLMIVGALLMPISAPSNAAFALLSLWLVLFFYGWLGLIFTSPWVQTHGFAIALAAIPTIGLSTILFFDGIAHPALFPQLILIPMGIAIYGLAMVMTPIFVNFSRAGGLID